ncbi:DUF6383 domain-containing protein [Parabacteroides sp. PF5-6]|uniref:DUF6383 domain-containing protein n=1 Tax=Parabacteroides sp. PF5-6 TaxID=1742403 RepID=UPI0024075444|nr:DUF6383 domain-containing protein [Parabacteroides sp. PF5-6]MDF9830516.1 hypothetical protein [Parabacteroides sp. PF5-6]
MQRIILHVFLSVFFFSVSSFQAMAQETTISTPGPQTITGVHTSITFAEGAGGTYTFNEVETDVLTVDAGVDILIELTGGNGKNTIGKITNNGTVFLKGNTFLPELDDQHVTNNAFLTDSTASIKVVNGVAPVISGLIEGSEVHNDSVATFAHVLVVGQQQLDPNIIQPIELPETLTLICQRKNILWWYDIDTLYIPVMNRIVSVEHEVKRAGQYRYRTIAEYENARTEIISNTAEVKMSYDVTLPEVEGVTTDPEAGTHIVPDGGNFKFYLSLDPKYSLSEPFVTTSKSDTLEVDWNGYYTLEAVTDSVTIFIDGIALDNPSSNTGIATDDLIIHGGQGQIEIYTPEATRLKILTFDGITRRNIRLTAGNHRIALPAGIYLLQTDRKTVKVVVK